MHSNTVLVAFSNLSYWLTGVRVQCAATQRRSGVRVKGPVVTVTLTTRPSATTRSNAASDGAGTRPLKPPTGRNSRPVAMM